MKQHYGKPSLALENTTPSAARDRLLELEKTHGVRREWVWAKLAQAPLAAALEHLAMLAKRTGSKLGGASVAEMAKLYVDAAWEIDSAALSAMATVKSSADAQTVGKALNAIYRPWLESAAEHLQALAEKKPLPGHDGQGLEDLFVESGELILFADGLRFDVSQRLVKHMREKGWTVTMSTRWAGLPTVTATAKPAVSPVTKEIKGLALGEDFLPATAVGGQPLTTDRFRKLLVAAGYRYLSSDETGAPSARAWTENGELDKLGHSLQGKLAGRIEEQMEFLLERIESLLDAGWREIRVVTDHGWLWLPGGLPKVELPKYLTASRWARCAAIKGDSKIEMPTVCWHWNSHERVAVAPGIACFSASNEYAHGGLSLQESLIPVIRVTAGEAASKTAATVADVSWAGLRCRVQIEPAQPGLSVDLRTKVNDPGSSVSTVRVVDTKGAASFLVADDALEGITAAVVVLDVSGHAIAKQPTIIGGEKLKVELDSLDRLAATAFEGYLVRKDLVRKYSRQYPVPTYVVEFLLGRYCASTNEQEIEEGLTVVERQLADRTVRTGEEELFKARARDQGSIKLIDIVRAKLDAKTDSFVAELPSLAIKDVRIDDLLVKQHERMLTDGFYAEITLSYDAAIAQEKGGRPFAIDSLRAIQLSKADVLDYTQTRSPQLHH